MFLVGFSFFGDPFSESGGWTEENEIGRLWQRFMTYCEHHQDRVKQYTDDQAAYEVHIEHEHTMTRGHLEVFVGMEIGQCVDIPFELLVKVLPATTYAIFTLCGEEIVSDWPRWIYLEWLPQSGYKVAYNYHLQLYDRRFKGLDRLEESEIEVYVPITKSSGTV